MTTCKEVAPAEVCSAALLEREFTTESPEGYVEPELCKRNCFIDDAFTGTAWKHSSLMQQEHGHANSPSSS